MARRPKMTPENEKRAAELALAAAARTRHMTALADEIETEARERAAEWAEAMELGASAQRLADAAGIHKSQVQKAIDRYAA